MAEEQKETSADFKNKAKRWLQANRYDYKWLAGQLGLAVGTVRNWFYTDAPITAENQHRMTAIFTDNQLTRGATRGADAPACLSFRLFKNGDNLDMLPWAIGCGVGKGDFSELAAVKEYEPQCAEDPGKCWNGAARAAFVLTEKLNEEAKSIIQHYVEGVKDKSTIKLSEIAKAEVFVKDSSSPAEVPQIPRVQVVESRFQLMYARIAAKMEGFATVEEWINAFVDKVAEEAFLSDFGLKESKYEARGISIVAYRSSDEI